MSSEVFDRLGELARGALDEVQAAGPAPDRRDRRAARPGRHRARLAARRAEPALGGRPGRRAAARAHRRHGRCRSALDNEANLAALAELWEGAATGVSDFVYASGEIGVGGGIVLGGELFRGYRGFGGEFGHTTVEPDGLPCACGCRGCLETRAGLEPLLAAAGHQRRGRPLARLGKPVARARPARAGRATPPALAALADCGRWLGVALGTVVNLLSPQAIVLGGYFAPMTEWLAPVIAVRARRLRVLGGNGAVPPVLPSSLGAEAAMRGAAATQLRRVLADPTLVGARPRRRRRRGGRRRLSARPRRDPAAVGAADGRLDVALPARRLAK